MHARLASVAAAVALLAILVIRPAIGPIGARAIGALPACRYDDLLTSPRGYDDWSSTLVDTILAVPKGYVPPDLVPVSEAGLTGNSQVRAIVIDDLRAMRRAASAAGAAFGIESAYRSYGDQQQVFDAWVRQFGAHQTLLTPARPGHSEHQLGVAIDFRSDAGGSPPAGAFGSTAAGKWMAAHAWEYGFVMSYPKAEAATTCYGSEPWHFRYVGRGRAADIRASGLTLRAYLWANFTTTVVPPSIASPGMSGAPLPAPRSTASSIPLETETASPTPTGTALQPTAAGTSAGPATPPDTTDRIDPAVAAGAQPALVLIAGITFALIIGGLWLAARRRRPGPGPGG
ncbi:MAG TPA: D-alanyl-D-alanine carboxypeptidase family protein [Candidatus Dormibacteraeota bacterium]|nr:D-alanyl-D-alanine carboxypeptidase family protein [Candidatus Dormibacteraeota bacterium]